MKFLSPFKKWIFGTLITTVVLASATFLYFRSQIDHVLGEELSAAVEEIQITSGIVGLAFGVVQNGEILLLEGFGETKLGAEDTVTRSHIFHWASVSKPFVAIAIMQLVEKNQLRLEDSLVEVLPDYTVTDPRHQEITIEQLLLHTSGLPDVEDYEWDKPQEDSEALMRWATKESPRELLFDPGTDRKYSNIGFEVLGAVLEQISGDTFDGYMKTNILVPAGMENSSFLFPEIRSDLRTTGHTGSGENKAIADHYPWNRRHGPSSTLNTSVEEMSGFVSALLSDRLLKAETRSTMWQARWPINDDGSQAGTLGWSFREQEGVRIWLHTGADVGFRSALAIFPDTQSAVFLVSNDEAAPIVPILFTSFEFLFTD